ncbi:MAG: AbrB/MazE/SpoVT family DNA-binding domain-containing protein [Lewinellaceae bacterium]|nr:AbrB/MazE/SpoVT family DNA-binding domain-containing protein [Lewinella sp.]MCB9281576.1 AbrB/MazE/SpoVT family DNA-binding domain-containing protein [Lewinellaceae bacterium]
MKVSVVQIGNSKGIRLNKMLLEKYQIEDKVELVLESEYILIKPVRQPRQGWDDAFAEMRKNEDDQLLIDPVFDDETPDE